MSGNEQKTVSKSQIDMNLDMQGISLNMPLWVDMDLTGENPKLVEVMKVPPIATASFPSQFANKEYMVINPYDMKDAGVSNLDLTKLMEFSQSFQTDGVNFLTSYAQRFNPNLDAVKVPTNDGTQEYTIKLNDAQLKEFMSYTVNNFAQDKEAMDFIKGFLKSMVELGAVPDTLTSLSDLDQAFEELDANIPEFLAQFNTIMDQLKNVSLLGDKGLELNYTISDGYIVKESGIINFKVDLSQINSLMSTLGGQQGAAIDAKGALNLTVNFNTDITGINAPMDIQIPELNKNNSFNYMVYLST